MRVILIGQAAFADRVLEGLVARGHDVAAVYCPPDSGGKPDPAKVRAQTLGIAVRQHPSLKHPEVTPEFEAYRADLAVLAYVTQIVPPSIFNLPRLGSICFHPSILPRYRGGSAINWQIIKGETETGVSVFWVDAGIDTGPVLLQKRAVIGPNDTAGSLYYEKLFPIGIEATLEAVDLVAEGRAPRMAQDESKASYDPLCRDPHAQIDWQRPVGELYNLIRGCDPQPGAYCLFNGGKLRLHECQAVIGGAHRPGVIVEVGPEGLVVGAKGGAIRIKRLRLTDRKVPAAEFAETAGLTVGGAM
jgi:methionyl-tRNA formyltransferase